MRAPKGIRSQMGGHTHPQHTPHANPLTLCYTLVLTNMLTVHANPLMSCYTLVLQPTHAVLHAVLHVRTAMSLTAE